MLDPFPFAAPAALQHATQPLATYLCLPTLPFHIHEVLFAITLYTLIDIWISPRLSTILCPQTYPHLDKRTTINWNVHVVSLFQSVIICLIALYVICFDEERGGMNWAGRIWGYTGAGGLLQAFATGYFVWDFCVTVSHFEIFGWGLLAHAVSALAVFCLGFRPFVNFYGPIFILYELSTPFLNIHWFLDKLHLTGSNYQWINGILLITVFFFSRIVWGLLNSFFVTMDVLTAWNNGSIIYDETDPAGTKLGLGSDVQAAMYGGKDPKAEIMRFASDRSVPLWLAGSYLAANVTLNVLNMYWIGQMVKTIRARFDPPFGTKGTLPAKQRKEKKRQ